jgi:hypothetical protein
VRSQKPGTGNSNLVQHVREAHENWEQQLEAARKNSITRYFQADAKSYQIYGWTVGWTLSFLKGIFAENIFRFLSIRLPLSTCGKENFRRYVDLETICTNTLLKYVEKLTVALEAKIAHDWLSAKFPLVFDGWTLTGTSTHYVCVLAQFLGEVFSFIDYCCVLAKS